jgi:ribokinase
VTGPVVYSMGSILVDVAVEVPGLPQRGGDVVATGSRASAGGGFNVAAAVARQQVSCVYGAPHGTGRNGEVIRAALAAEGIAVAGPPRADGDSGFCLVLVEPDGERTFVTAPGVEASLSPSDLGRLHPAAGDAVSVSGYDLLYPGTGPVLAAWLSGLPAGVLVVLDPGPLVMDIPADRLRPVLRRTDLLTVNRQEARSLGGSALPSALTGFTPGMVVVRSGAAGCAATGGRLGDRVVTVPAPRVPAVDTTGAGDSHTGVLLAGLLTGFAPDAALATANRAAAISVTRPGPATCPTRAELGP